MSAGELPQRKPLTAEQERRRAEVRERTDAIQRRGIRPPASGTFGKGVPDSEARKKRERGKR